MLVLASEQIFDCRELVLETLVNYCVVNNGGYLTGVQYFVRRASFCRFGALLILVS